MATDAGDGCRGDNLHPDLFERRQILKVASVACRLCRLSPGDVDWRQGTRNESYNFSGRQNGEIEAMNRFISVRGYVRHLNASKILAPIVAYANGVVHEGHFLGTAAEIVRQFALAGSVPLMHA